MTDEQRKRVVEVLEAVALASERRPEAGPEAAWLAVCESLDGDTYEDDADELHALAAAVRVPTSPPPSDPTSDAERAVLDAAMAWMHDDGDRETLALLRAATRLFRLRALP